jgi:hypothetical protein
MKTLDIFAVGRRFFLMKGHKRAAKKIFKPTRIVKSVRPDCFVSIPIREKGFKTTMNS